MNDPPSPPASPGTRRTILIIDDEAPFAEILASGLETGGYHAVQASNAATGWDLAHAHQPDLILCDIDMPGKDGLRLLRDIREDPELADSPFVLMTGKPKYGNQRAAMDLGADDFLLKPFSLPALISCVDARLKRAAIRRRRGEGAAPRPAGFLLRQLQRLAGQRLSWRLAQRPAAWSPLHLALALALEWRLECKMPKRWLLQMRQLAPRTHVWSDCLSFSSSPSKWTQ